MEMTIPITLIVKAPNQQIEDQTVKCELSWTIHKLKGHLSEVYPSKPTRDEQKLIYSGQLLSDSVVLKDILRNYDEQNTHTVHLVCSPTRSYKCEKQTITRKPEMNPATQTSVPEAIPTTSSGIRNRQGLSIQSQETSTDFQTMWTTFAQPQAHVVDPSQYAIQFALFQQAYAQYINQYMQMVSSQMPQNQRIAEAQPEPEAAPEPAAEPGPAADDADADEIQPDRDWLDWFYVFSRVLVLFCIVYFYSSPLRFAFVLLLGIGLYLYQVGFFRVQNVNNNEAQRQENNNVPPVQGQAEDSNQTVNPEQRPTMLNIMWTFFTTFFASLIPEIPNAV